MRIASVAALLVVSVGTLAGGCTPHFAIRYSLDDVRTVKDPRLAQLTLRIGPFRDQRSTAPEASFLFSSGRETEVNGQKSCVNAEQNYDVPAVVEQVVNAIALHLRRMETYAAVETTEVPKSYVLSGTLRRFYGVQTTSTAAQVGAAFGLIGALATMNEKTKGTIDIELTNLQLIGPNGQKVAQLSNVKEHYQGDLPADADCNVIFESVNDQLKIAVEKLATQLLGELRNVVNPWPVPKAEAKP
jgi:hypothetical protein